MEPEIALNYDLSCQRGLTSHLYVQKCTNELISGDTIERRHQSPFHFSPLKYSVNHISSLFSLLIHISGSILYPKSMDCWMKKRDKNCLVNEIKMVGAGDKMYYLPIEARMCCIKLIEPFRMPSWVSNSRSVSSRLQNSTWFDEIKWWRFKSKFCKTSACFFLCKSSARTMIPWKSEQWRFFSLEISSTSAPFPRIYND